MKLIVISVYFCPSKYLSIALLLPKQLENIISKPQEVA